MIIRFTKVLYFWFTGLCFLFGTRYITQQLEIIKRVIKICQDFVKNYQESFWIILIRSYQDFIYNYLEMLVFQVLGKLFYVLQEIQYHACLIKAYQVSIHCDVFHFSSTSFRINFFLDNQTDLLCWLQFIFGVTILCPDICKSTLW